MNGLSQHMVCNNDVESHGFNLAQNTAITLFFFSSCKKLIMYLTSELHSLLILVYAALLCSLLFMELYW